MKSFPAQSSWLSFGLNLLGFAVGSYFVLSYTHLDRPAWLWVLIWIALGAWLVRSVLRLFGLPGSLALELVMLVTGAIATGGTNGIGIVTVIVVILYSTSRVERPLSLSLGMAGLAAVIIPFSAAPFDQGLVSVLSMEAGIVVAVLAGVSRRQFRESEHQSALLREREVEARAEHSRAELLAQKQEAARDIHDVLAHSLGALVIQLDAVEALLEAGDVAAAQKRVTDARALAASGLGEARRAVAALRESADPTTTDLAPADFEAVIADLISAHRSLGGAVDFSESGQPRALPSDAALAVQRALQESLSNARKHAPGEPVAVHLDWTADTVRLRLTNPLAKATTPPSALAQTGGGHGLSGMRERFDALRLGGSVSASASAEHADFVVLAEARLR